jgi:hypothetical protein
MDRRWRHGDARGDGPYPPLYTAWRNMKRRCFNPSDESYHNYGGRGITVCEEWLDWVLFRDYIAANLGPRPPGLTLDRIDNDGNYEPGNVRWATYTEQNRNRRPLKRKKVEAACTQTW